MATEWASRIQFDDVNSIRDAFVVAMIWGHGLTPYGPYRTLKVMSQPDFDDQIAALAHMAAAEGGPQAYQFVHDQRWGLGHQPAYLHKLGTAFGTKFIYFVTKAKLGAPSPVLDRVMQSWFADNAPDVDVRVDQWDHPERYLKYVDTLTGWGAVLGLQADDVERVAFAQQLADEAPNGPESWALEGTRARRDIHAGDRLVGFVVS